MSLDSAGADAPPPLSNVDSSDVEEEEVEDDLAQATDNGITAGSMYDVAASEFDVGESALDLGTDDGTNRLASREQGANRHDSFPFLNSMLDSQEPPTGPTSGLPASDGSMLPPYNDDYEGNGRENEPSAADILTELEVAGQPLAEIITMDKFRRRIARDYQRFLTTFTDENGHSVYHARIKTMCSLNSESLEVSYLHLVEANAFLAKLVANLPAATLAIFDEATMRIVLRLFENYDRIKSEVHVRITDFPTVDNLRDLRYNHLNTLVRVSGVVTRRSGVFPQLKLVKYDCVRCGAVLGPFVQDLSQEIKVNACSECESRGPFNVNSAQTVYRNYQKLTLQESPGTVPAGRLPRHKEVVLLLRFQSSILIL